MTTIKLRRGTAAEWTTANPILAAGEMGIETDTRKFKFGDGTTPWNTLAYASAEGGGGTGDVTAAGDNRFTGDNTFTGKVNIAGGALTVDGLANINQATVQYLNATNITSPGEINAVSIKTNGLRSDDIQTTENKKYLTEVDVDNQTIQIVEGKLHANLDELNNEVNNLSGRVTANEANIQTKQDILADGNGTKIVDNKIDINQGTAGINGLNIYQNNGTITKNDDLSIAFNNGACGYIYFPNKGVNNNYEVVLHCAYNGTHGSRDDSVIHEIRVEPNTNFPNEPLSQGFIWIDVWSSPFRVVIVNKDSTQDYSTNIPTVKYIKYTIIGTKIRLYYSTDGVDYTSVTYNNHLDYVEISETGAYLNLCIASRNLDSEIGSCWTNTTLFPDSYVLDKSTNTYLMKQGIANEGVAVATSTKYGLVLPDNSTIVSNNGIMSVVPSAIAGYGMPSNRYIDLTPGANGTKYIAPADGWIAFAKKLTATGQFVGLSNDTTSMAIMGCNASDGPGGNASCFIPCKKGDEVVTWYSAGGDVLKLRFIYAKGVQ